MDRFWPIQIAILGLCGLAAPACAKPMINLQDCVVTPDGKTTLVADIRKETFLGIAKDVEHQIIHFHAAGRELGAVKGGEDGISILDCTLPDHEIESIEATATIDGQNLHAEARVFRWDPARVVLVVDIDDTICRTDLDDVLFDDEDDSKSHKHARETLTELAGDYELLYLTARPSFLLEKTRKWLAMRGFPAAPIVVSHLKRDLLNQGRFKAQVLERLKRDWPNILIGIGDRTSDAHAYGETGLLSIIVGSKPDEEFGRHSIRMHDWRMIRQFFQNNRRTLTDPRECRDAVDGGRPLLFTVNPYKPDDD